MKEKTSVFKENFLFWLMFGVFFILWLTTTVIFIFFCRYYGVYGTEGSIGAYANLLVFDATIFAPIAAYFFYDNWKEQNKLIKISNLSSEALDVCHELKSSIFKIRAVHNNSLLGVYRITMLLNPFKDEIKSPDIHLKKLSKKVRIIQKVSGNNLTVDLTKKIIEKKLELENYLNDIFRSNWNYEIDKKIIKEKVSELHKEINNLEDELFKYIRYEQK